MRIPVRVLDQAFAVALGICLLCLPLFGQGTAGRILGTITDQTGAVIANATVTVTDIQRGIARTLASDQSGEYIAPSLLPGTYSVKAEAKGFKTAEHTGLLLEVGRDVRVDLSLQPGEQTQTVTVSGETPLVETTNATLGGTLSNETINDLPMMGRSYQNLLVLRPGMMIYPGGGGWTMSTNGSRPEENTFILEGLTNDNPLQGLTIINGPGVAGDAATLMPIDAIQELNIQENPPAEYGGKGGAVVNVGIKSGTNSLHGTAYAFGRDSAWDARNYFNPTPQPQRPVSLQQFGATAGGRIIKDKLFFFVGYEGERYTVGNTFSANVPEVSPQATADPANSLPDAIADLKNNGVAPSALGLALTGCTLGPPVKCTGGLYPQNVGTSKSIIQGFPSIFGSDNGVLKIDYHINDRNTLSGYYFQSEGVITAEDVVYLQQQWRSVQDNRPRVLGINWTSTLSSRWVNVARFGYVLMNRGTQQVDSSVPTSTYGIYTGVTTTGSLPIIQVKGFTNLGGSPGWPYRFGPDTVYQGVDYVSYLRGNHAFKFGGEIRRNLANPSQFGAAKGHIFFQGGRAFPGSSSLEDILAGDPAFATIQSGSPARQLQQWNTALSVQDDWRFTPRLTLNLGLRYEYTTPMSEANNLLGGFEPGVGMVQVGHQISSLYNPDRTDFGPRLGLAWDISGKGTTVVRAGYSLIFDSLLPMQTFTGVAGNAPNGVGGVATVPTGATLVVNGVSTKGTGSIAVANVTVPGGAGSPLALNWQNNGPNRPIFSGANSVECGDGSNDAAGNATSPCALAVLDHNFRDPYIQNWTLGVQHAITTNMSVDVSYVGSHGSRLNGIRDINQGVPDAAAAASGTPVGMPFANQYPYLSYIIEMSNLYESNYAGLQTTLQQRTAHGLSFTLGYTYSHSLDDDSYNIGQYLPQDSTHPGREYASSDFDITHRFTFSMTYALPGKKSPAQLLEGWEVNSIVTLQTGQPWYGNDQSDNISGTLEGTDRWDFFGNNADFKSGNSSIPYCSGADFSVPSSISCSQLTPVAGVESTVNLSSAQNTAAANACYKAANAVNAATVSSLDTYGCYFQGHSVLIPPALGTFGTAGRNDWRDPGLRNWDLSVIKSFKFGERLTAQFRAEFFNVLNHPNFANPYGASNGFGIGSYSDPSSTVLGCGCATPDQAGGNPVLGSGGNRATQLGLKLIF
jgi:carboxypeptidase family protein/TonB-dependent receptor-like protein